MDYVKPQPQNYPLANHLGLRKYPQCNITAEKYISAPKPFSRVVLTWEHLQRSIFTFLNLGAALVVSIPPLETSEPADGCDCMAFQGIRSVSFMSVISVRNRKLFSHLIHIIDKMRN